MRLNGEQVTAAIDLAFLGLSAVYGAYSQASHDFFGMAIAITAMAIAAAGVGMFFH